MSNATLAVNLKQTKGRWTVYFKCQGCKRRITRLEQGLVFSTGSWLSICHAKLECQNGIKEGTDWTTLKNIFDGLLNGLGILEFTVRPPLMDDAWSGTISGSIASGVKRKEISGLVISLGTNPRSSRKRTRKKRR